VQLGAVIGAVSLALWATLGAAAPRPSIHLEVRRGPRAETCPSAEDMAALLVTRLGYSPVEADAADGVALEFRSEGDGLAVRLELSRAGQPPRSRELKDPDRSCVPLAAATAFAIAIAVDPQRARATPEAPTQPAPPQAPQPAAPAPPPPAPKEAPPSIAVGWELGVAGAGVLGAGPNPTAAALLHGGVSLDRFHMGLEARIDVPQTWRSGTGAVTSYLVLGNLVPCAALARFSLCVVLSAGALRAGSAGLVGSTNLSAPMVLLGARVGLMFRPLKWVQLTPWIDVGAALTRVTLTVDGAAVWVTPPLAGLVGVRFSVAAQ
jgi:hypothetical protein